MSIVELGELASKELQHLVENKWRTWHPFELYAEADIRDS